jgi:hypothetical protein
MDRAIETQGPVFWQALQDRLALAIDSLPGDGELTGSITSFGGGVRITVTKLGMAFNQAYTDLFYKRGSSEIRCSALNGSPYVLRFAPTADGKIGVKSTLGISSMDPNEAGEHIMELMLRSIDRK